MLANHRRGERRRLALADRLKAERAVSYRQPEFASGVTEIAAAFRQLPVPDQELLALAGWEGLAPGEIATVIGCSRNAARIRLHRARRRLAGQLDRAPHGTAAGRARVTNGDLA